MERESDNDTILDMTGAMDKSDNMEQKQTDSI
jgi:hypothetical protein